jgi:hypothetical protein
MFFLAPNKRQASSDQASMARSQKVAAIPFKQLMCQETLRNIKGTLKATQTGSKSINVPYRSEIEGT